MLCTKLQQVSFLLRYNILITEELEELVHLGEKQ